MCDEYVMAIKHQTHTEETGSEAGWVQLCSEMHSLTRILRHACWREGDGALESDPFMRRESGDAATWRRQRAPSWASAVGCLEVSVCFPVQILAADNIFFGSVKL